MASEKLRAFMAWAGITQSALAARLGIHQTSAGRLLSGRRRPGIAVAYAIERLTSEARADGTTWEDGPISAAEWLSVETQREASGAVGES